MTWSSVRTVVLDFVGTIFWGVLKLLTPWSCPKKFWLIYSRVVWVSECLQSPWQTNKQKRLRYNWQKNWGTLVCIVWWFDGFAQSNTSITSHCFCFFVFGWECLRSLLANFSYTVTVLSTVVTMLFISSSELTHLDNWQLINYQFTNLSLFLPTSIPMAVTILLPSFCAFRWLMPCSHLHFSDLFLLLRA